MSLTNDIPTKLRVPAQLALDAKTVVTSLSQLQTLGTNNNLAYTYYKGMEVLCSENLGIYRWRPVNEGETGGTLPSNFTYPAGIVSEDGVVYSNIAYNFFKETTLTVENLIGLVQIMNVGIGAGVYKDTTGLVHNLKTLISSNSSVIITENATTIDLKSTEGGTSINLQRIISTDYILSDVDDKHTIFIDNGSDKVFITIPLGLKPNFFCVFLQQGTGEVLFINDVGVTVLTPIGYYIKGQYYWAHLEKVENQEVYHLLATVKSIE